MLGNVMKAGHVKTLEKPRLDRSPLQNDSKYQNQEQLKNRYVKKTRITLRPNVTAKRLRNKILQYGGESWELIQQKKVDIDMRTEEDGEVGTVQNRLRALEECFQSSGQMQLRRWRPWRLHSNSCSEHRVSPEHEPAEQEEMVSKVTTTSSTTAASDLSRQTSIYSLTIDEFQNAVNEPNKSFGSMNMDEFLKNIWTAEESQAMAAAMVGGADVSNNASPANLARQPSLAKQGSLTLPRNMIGKTVDEVWREINANLSDNSNSASENKADEKSKAAVQRDPTFGEMTLEDFLAKAGVVREDCAVNQAANGAISSAVQSGLTQSPQQQQQDWINFQFKSNPHALQTQQQLQQQQMFTKPQHLMLSPQQQHQQQHLMLNTQQQQFQQQQQIQQLQHHHHQQQHQQQIQQHQPQQQQQQQQQLDASMPLFATRLMPAAGVPALQSSSTGSVLEASIESGATSSVVSVGFGKGLNLSPSMLSPETPGRGKKRGLDAPENKVVEQRQRRMIKNRESAARSRERKQAYTMELESEVTQLKEENALLNKQQVEATKKRRKQLMETLIPVEEMRQPPRVLRRTRTIHW